MYLLFNLQVQVGLRDPKGLKVSIMARKALPRVPLEERSLGFLKFGYFLGVRIIMSIVFGGLFRETTMFRPRQHVRLRIWTGKRFLITIPGC